MSNVSLGICRKSKEHGTPPLRKQSRYMDVRHGRSLGTCGGYS